MDELRSMSVQAKMGIIHLNVGRHLRIAATEERIDHRCRDNSTGTTHLSGSSLSSLCTSYTFHLRHQHHLMLGVT